MYGASCCEIYDMCHVCVVFPLLLLFVPTDLYVNFRSRLPARLLARSHAWERND